MEKLAKEGVGASIWVSYPKNDKKICSYKLYFDCTNNVAKYKALILGLKMLKDLKAKKIYVYGYSELVIN